VLFLGGGVVKAITVGAEKKKGQGGTTAKVRRPQREGNGSWGDCSRDRVGRMGKKEK